ncbi:MAG TPA: NAD(P)-binding domain-containing protein, partial [Solirubrobacteraceae bacterium]|nr:NAD(P)-binding domain-containing protein [Solirubrobacteraceae bacterium]
MDHGQNRMRYGWIGIGRMGAALVERLLDAGCDVAVYNRTREKAEALAERGATVVDTPAELADRDIVFTMVAGPGDFRDVVLGAGGLLSRGDT